MTYFSSFGLDHTSHHVNTKKTDATLKNTIYPGRQNILEYTKKYWKVDNFN